MNRFKKGLLETTPPWLWCGAFTDAGDGDGGGGGGNDDAPIEEEIDNIDDDVLAAMDELGAGGEGDDGQQRQDGQPRDEGGRFKKGEKPDTQQRQPLRQARKPGDPPADQQQQKPAPKNQQQPPAKPPAAQQGARMPDGWLPKWVKPIEGYDLNTLPPALREQWYAREQAFSRTYNEMNGALKAWEPINKALGPMAEQLKQSGASVQGFVSNLVRVEDWIHADSGDETKFTLEPLEWLAQNYYGKPLAELMKLRVAPSGGGGNNNGAATQPSPELTALTNRIGAIENDFQQRKTAERDARRAAFREQFDKLCEEHPEARDQAVIDIMKGLLTSGQARDYADAFEKASWLHPPLRERTLQAQRKATAKTARTAAISPRGTSPSRGASSGSSNHTASIDEDVRAALSELQ